MLSTLALSAIAGWSSIACWIVVYSPQIVENYQLQSGEGLSLAFIVLWLIGDLTNLVGGLMVNLVPALVLLAAYYLVCDVILLFQLFYYRRLALARATAASADDTQPLLPAKPPSAAPEPKSWASQTAQFAGALGLVIGAGLVAWWVTTADEGHGRGGGEGSPVEPAPVIFEWKSQTLGWVSAATYIASRLPQLVHNYRTRCEGLSLAMFFFSITGNTTYIASILFKSVERNYILVNLPWLCGSGGTILLDILVLAQFGFFARQRPLLVASEADEEE